MKVLEKAGLIHVVRTRQVRAVTETVLRPRRAPLPVRERRRRTASDLRNVAVAALRRAAEEMLPFGEDPGTTFGVLRGRLAPADAQRFERRSKRCSTTSVRPSRPRASRTVSRSRSTAEPTLRSLRRPSGGLWANADFLKLWAGQSISEFGSQISALAIPWLAAVGLHVSPFAFSVLGMLGFLPFILFALPAGVWVDRLQRRPILIVGDSARALLLGYIPVAWALGILDVLPAVRPRSS